MIVWKRVAIAIRRNRTERSRWPATGPAQQAAAQKPDASRFSNAAACRRKSHGGAYLTTFACTSAERRWPRFPRRLAHWRRRQLCAPNNATGSTQPQLAVWQWFAAFDCADRRGCLIAVYRTDAGELHSLRHAWIAKTSGVVADVACWQGGQRARLKRIPLFVRLFCLTVWLASRGLDSCLALRFSPLPPRSRRSH